MAENNKNTPPTEKKPEGVKVRVVTNYGRHKPGEWIFVTKEQYAKYRLLETQGRPRVFISQADMDAEETEVKAAEEQRIKDLRRNDEHRDGWQRYQQESEKMVKAQRIQAQKAQMDAVLGSSAPAMTAEEQQAKYREQVAISRTG